MMRIPRRSERSLVRLAACVLLLAPGCAGAGRPASTADPPAASARFGRQEPFVTRPLSLTSGDRWIGNGIAYGMHRDGQWPGGPAPTREQIREDLHLMAKRWGFIRVYQALGPAEMVLDVIRQDRLDLKVMLGAWIDVEVRVDERGSVVAAYPETLAANRRELDAAVRLATKYPDFVRAISVGNETQVSWTGHRIPAPVLIRYLREARARTGVPVTTSDDFNFWNKPESADVAREVDFLDVHAHPLWNGIQLDQAIDWTRRTYESIEAAHPGLTIVLGETGWATAKHNAGEQAKLIKGIPGEAEQKRFLEEFNAWVDRDHVPTFFFEAFDENWKGGEPADEVEKHWGLYRADRTPKPAVANPG